MYISACLRGIWTHFTQLTCSDTMLVWMSNCSSLEHDASVKLAFPFSLSTTILFLFPCISFYPLPLTPNFFSHFRSLSSLIFPLILRLFRIFPKTGLAASSAGRILFRCQIKIPAKFAVLSQQWNKSGTLRVVSFWRRKTQIPPLERRQTRRLQLKGRYVAGVRGLFWSFHALMGCNQASITDPLCAQRQKNEKTHSKVISVC